MRIFLHPCIHWLLFFVVDEDECINGFAACGLQATCENTPGSYKCLCPRGFNYENGACQDIDECMGKACHKDAVCRNTPGNFSCSCSKKGYEGDGYQKCADIDECKIIANKVLYTCCILRSPCLVMWWAVQQPNRTSHACNENKKITTTPSVLIYRLTLKYFWAEPCSSKRNYCNPGLARMERFSDYLICLSVLNLNNFKYKTIRNTNREKPFYTRKSDTLANS